MVGSARTTIVVSTAVMSTPVITTTMARPVCEAGPDCRSADTARTLLLTTATSLSAAPTALRHNLAMISEIFDPSQWREVDGFDFTDITYHRAADSGTVRVAFNRPEVRNAFRPHTVDELYTALDH